MRRVFTVLVCTAFGAALIFCAVQIPVHLRAVDKAVLQMAGAGTPAFAEAGLARVRDNQLGAAELFVAAGESARVVGVDKLKRAVDNLVQQQPVLKFFGSPVDGTVVAAFKSTLSAVGTNGGELSPEPFTAFLVRAENRSRTLDVLHSSSIPLVQALLRFRSLTNTVLFSASSSASGQALDAAVALGGLLTEAGHLSAGVSDALGAALTDANSGGSPARAEQLLMDLMSLGQRLNWGQLASFVEQIRDAETLHSLAGLLRADDRVPLIYTAVCLSRDAAGVAHYVTKFGAAGMNDLGTSLRFGMGGVGELVRRNQRLCDYRFCDHVAALMPSLKLVPLTAALSQKAPGLALAVKWALYFFGGFLVASAMHAARRVPAREAPLEVRGFRVAREVLFALGFLLVVLLLSEPFLAPGNQKGTPPFQLRLPTVGSVVAAESSGAHTSIMNQFSLLTLLLFFVLQALIYIVCLIKLAEIRRQSVPARLRLKLLENEDHLFDAGLYLGFVGTIISLILVSLGVIKPSLMAAYSSTSFGILFVSFFKIFHLRPLRRKLLLEVEDEPRVRVAPSIPTAAILPS